MGLGFATGGFLGAGLGLGASAIPGVNDTVNDVLGGVGGFFTGEENKGKKRERALRQEARDLWDNIETPSADQLTPLLAQEGVNRARLLGPSFAAGAQADQYTVDAERAAIDNLAGWDNATLKDMQQQGMTGAERNMYSNAVDRSNREQAAAEQAALANLEQRGRTGGSQELMMRLQGAGNRASNASDLGAQMGMNAQNRALTAAQAYGSLQQTAQARSGQLATNARMNSFNERFQRGEARDKVQANNVGYQRDLNQRNVERLNTNYAQRAAARQQEFDNRYRKTGSQANARMGLGAFEGAQGDNFTRFLDRAGKVAETAAPFMQMAGAG